MVNAPAQMPVRVGPRAVTASGIRGGAAISGHGRQGAAAPGTLRCASRRTRTKRDPSPPVSSGKCTLREGGP